MKKLIALLLALSLLLCMGATVLAAEGKNGGDEPTTTVEAVPETAADSTVEEELTPAEPVEPETAARTDETDGTDGTETTAPAGEPETQEEDGQTESPALPEENAPTGDSEVSQEPETTVADSDAQPDAAQESEEEPAAEDDSLLAAPMAVEAATYNVTISWTGMEFTYHEGSKGAWNPTDMRPGPDEPHTWTSSDDSCTTCGTIKVTVNSEIQDVTLITASFKFDQEETFPSYVQMRFSTDKETVSSGKTTGKLEFNQASGKEMSMYVVPASGDLTAEDFTASSGKIGTITVTIKAQEIHDPESPEQPGME